MGLQLPEVTQGFGAAARSGLKGCAPSVPRQTLIPFLIGMQPSRER